jgi:hypothetical protein
LTQDLLYRPPIERKLSDETVVQPVRYDLG